MLRDVLGDPMFQGLGFVVATILACFALYYQTNRKIWLYVPLSIIIIVFPGWAFLTFFTSSNPLPFALALQSSTQTPVASILSTPAIRTDEPISSCEYGPFNFRDNVLTSFDNGNVSFSLNEGFWYIISENDNIRNPKTIRYHTQQGPMTIHMILPQFKLAWECTNYSASFFEGTKMAEEEKRKNQASIVYGPDGGEIK